MKAAILSVAFLALSPPTAARWCKHYIMYCGAYLLDSKGYSEADLKEVTPPGEPIGQIRKNLYRCMDYDDHILYWGMCGSKGCVNGGSSKDDYCLSSTGGLAANGQQEGFEVQVKGAHIEIDLV